MPKTKQCIDHLGNTFPSESAMCKHYGIATSTFQNRRDNLHMSLEDALTKKPENHTNSRQKCKDHLGNEFPSKDAMCKHWGIPKQVYFGRIKLGWKLEDILTKPLDYKGGAKPVSDHTGQIFETIGLMCEHWNMPRTTYNARIKKGWSIEKALTTPVKPMKIKTKECIDHLGNKFESQNAMCRHYGITKSLLTTRLKLGWTLKQILTNPDVINPKKKCKDHLGNEFDSITEMIQHYGVSEQTYRRRLRLGESLEFALTGNNQNFKRCFDHLGNEFQSVDDMCSYWNINKGTYYARLSSGKSLRETLSTINDDTVIDDRLTVLNKLEEPYYRVQFDNEIDIWFDYEIMQYYRKRCYKKEEK